MGFECYVATKYDVEFAGPQFDYDEFIDLVDDLFIRSRELNLEDPNYAWDDAGTYWEFDRDKLKALQKALNVEDEDDKKLSKFIDQLLLGTPTEDFIRVECF